MKFLYFIILLSLAIIIFTFYPPKNTESLNDCLGDGETTIEFINYCKSKNDK